jgi:RHS repeat-associated protein
VVDRVALEMRSTRKCTGSSNLPLSAIFCIGHHGIADQSGATAFVYNALGQIITDIRVIAAKIYRPMSNLLTSLAHGNGLNPSAGYDLDYRLSSLALKDGALNVSSLAYAYTDNLNLTGITDGVTAANSNVLSYSATNRLAAASGAWGSNTFTYDAVGNRLTDVTTTKNRIATYATYGYNALQQLTTRVATAVGAPIGQVAYIYDLEGHLIAEATASSGATTRDYIWAASNDNTPVDLPLAVAEAATLHYVHTDHLGRPIRMTDAAKSTVWQALYKPFGEVQTTSGTKSLDLRFPGQYFQIETAYAYNWNRHYDPITGRYTQPDPLRFVDGPSMYAYAGNSPFMLTDREGLNANVIAAGTTTLAGGLFAVAYAWWNWGDCLTLGDYGTAFGIGAGEGAKAGLWAAAGGAAGSKAWQLGSKVLTSLRGAATADTGAVGVGLFAGGSIAARSAARNFTAAERAQINNIGNKSGCHTCGTLNLGTRSGNFVPDHQPPTALNPTGGPQQLYPQCIGCSREQGLTIARQLSGGSQ